MYKLFQALFLSTPCFFVSVVLLVLGIGPTLFDSDKLACAKFSMLRRYGWALFCVKMVNHVGTVSVLIASICINLCGSFCVSRDKFSDLMQSSVSRGMKDFVASYRRYKNLSFLRYQYCWRVIDLTFGGLEFIFEINEVICWPDFDGKWFHRWVWCRRVIFVMFEDWHLLEYSSDVYNIAPELGKLLHTHHHPPPIHIEK